jgi:hypothetical protein
LLILPLRNQQSTPCIIIPSQRRQPLCFPLLVCRFTLRAREFSLEVPLLDFAGCALAGGTELEFGACGKVLLEEGAGSGFGFSADGGCPAGGRG